MITGQTKFSHAMDLIRPFAKQKGLPLSTWKQFIKAVKIYNQ